VNVLLANKIKMSQIFDENGKVQPVTVLDAKTFVTSNSGDKVLAGLGKDAKAGKAKLGIYKDLGYAPRFVKEYSKDDSFGLENFAEGDTVKITSVSKGKGFAGVVKRYNMQGGPKTHGATDKTRSVGSIGTKTIGRVILGKRMAGRMGSDTVTVKGLKVVKVDQENKLLILKGSVPGGKNTPVVIEKN
jgi:large subunit ribosomal protein L3